MSLPVYVDRLLLRARPLPPAAFISVLQRERVYKSVSEGVLEWEDVSV